MTAARITAAVLALTGLRYALFRLGEYLFPHPHEGPMEAVGDPLWQPRGREPWGET